MLQFSKQTATQKYNQKLNFVFHTASEVFAKEGYHKASIREIAKETGISLGSLYYYFSNKEELLFKISQNCFESIICSFSEKSKNVTEPKQKLFLLIENHVTYFVNHLSEMKILVHESDSLTGTYNETILQIKKNYIDLADKIIAEINPNLTDTRLVTLTLFGMMNWLYTWYNPKKPKNVDLIVQTIYKMALQGIENF